MLEEFRQQQSLGAIALGVGILGILLSVVIGLMASAVLPGSFAGGSFFHSVAAYGSIAFLILVLLAVREASHWTSPNLGTRYFLAYQLVTSTLVLLLQLALLSEPDPIEARALSILQRGFAGLLLSCSIVYILVAVASRTRLPLGTLFSILYTGAIGASAIAPGWPAV